MTISTDSQVALWRQLFSLEGKTALVTGGASGLGRVIAETLATAGATVFIASRNRAACEAAAAEMSAAGGGMVTGLSGDVGSEDGIAMLVRDLKKRTDRLDILVNNAGVTREGDLEEFPYGGWDGLLATNVTGLFHLTQQLLPQLRRAAGADCPARVINLGSIAGSVVTGTNAYSYAASKAAVHHLTRILALRLAKSHITVNAIAPGVFETPMTAAATSDPAIRARMVAAVPLRRLGTDQDIAGTLLYLCGRAGAYVSGTVAALDGGRHLAASAP